jgi:hypothetical protein
MDIEFPVRRVVGSGVELFDTTQVRQEVRAERSVNRNAFRDPWQHLFLNQSRVEVGGIERNESNLG